MNEDSKIKKRLCQQTIVDNEELNRHPYIPQMTKAYDRVASLIELKIFEV
jgi:hypothetical protein